MTDEVVRIVQRLSSDLGEPEGEATPLEGGITNRNYLVTLGGNRYVIRVPGKDTSLLGIDRSAEREANENAAAIGVAPRVVAQLDDPPCLVTEFVECTEMTPEGLRDPETTKQVLEAIRSVHESGANLPTNFDSFRVVEEYRETAASRGGEIPAAYDEAHQRARQIEAALSGPEHDPVPCHNDLLAGNFLRGSERIWIVDWEYAGMGDRYFDLANFAINNEFSESRPRRAAWRLLLGGGESEEAGDAAPDALHVGFPRGDVGGGPDRRLRPRRRFQGLRRHALRADAKDRGERELRRVARGGQP